MWAMCRLNRERNIYKVRFPNHIILYTSRRYGQRRRSGDCKAIAKMKMGSIGKITHFHFWNLTLWWYNSSNIFIFSLHSQVNKRIVYTTASALCSPKQYSSRRSYFHGSKPPHCATRNRDRTVGPGRSRNKQSIHSVAHHANAHVQTMCSDYVCVNFTWISMYTHNQTHASDHTVTYDLINSWEK